MPLVSQTSPLCPVRVSSTRARACCILLLPMDISCSPTESELGRHCRVYTDMQQKCTSLNNNNKMKVIHHTYIILVVDWEPISYPNNNNNNYYYYYYTIILGQDYSLHTLRTCWFCNHKFLTLLPLFTSNHFMQHFQRKILTQPVLFRWPTSARALRKRRR